jgi:hypothetical protein
MPFDFKKYDAKCNGLTPEELQLEWQHYTRLITGASTSTAISGMALPFTLGVSAVGIGMAAPAIHNARKKREIIERHLAKHNTTHQTRKRDVFGSMAFSGTVGIVTLGVGTMGAESIAANGAEHGISSIVENETAIKVVTHAALDGAGMGVERLHTEHKKKKEAHKAFEKAGVFQAVHDAKAAEAGYSNQPNMAQTSNQGGSSNQAGPHPAYADGTWVQPPPSYSDCTNSPATYGSDVKAQPAYTQNQQNQYYMQPLPGQQSVTYNYPPPQTQYQITPPQNQQQDYQQQQQYQQYPAPAMHSSQAPVLGPTSKSVEGAGDMGTMNQPHVGPPSGTGQQAIHPASGSVTHSPEAENDLRKQLTSLSISRKRVQQSDGSGSQRSDSISRKPVQQSEGPGSHQGHSQGQLQQQAPTHGISGQLTSDSDNRQVQPVEPINTGSSSPALLAPTPVQPIYTLQPEQRHQQEHPQPVTQPTPQGQPQISEQQSSQTPPPPVQQTPHWQPQTSVQQHPETPQPLVQEPSQQHFQPSGQQYSQAPQPLVHQIPQGHAQSAEQQYFQTPQPPVQQTFQHHPQMQEQPQQHYQTAQRRYTTPVQAQQYGTSAYSMQQQQQQQPYQQQMSPLQPQQTGSSQCSSPTVLRRPVPSSRSSISTPPTSYPGTPIPHQRPQSMMVNPAQFAPNEQSQRSQTPMSFPPPPPGGPPAANTTVFQPQGTNNYAAPQHFQYEHQPGGIRKSLAIMQAQQQQPQQQYFASQQQPQQQPQQHPQQQPQQPPQQQPQHQIYELQSYPPLQPQVQMQQRQAQMQQQQMQQPQHTRSQSQAPGSMPYPPAQVQHRHSVYFQPSADSQATYAYQQTFSPPTQATLVGSVFEPQQNHQQWGGQLNGQALAAQQQYFPPPPK